MMFDLIVQMFMEKGHTTVKSYELITLEQTFIREVQQIFFGPHSDRLVLGTFLSDC